MRQAGRYMQEYRTLRAQYSLLEICRTPDLATEVTLQPIRRLEVDAAILFSDLLLPLAPMGLPFDFILYSNYERQVEAQFSGEVHEAWNSPQASLLAERMAKARGESDQVRAIANLATDELSHPAPVFHGDTLFSESEVLEVRPSTSKPDRGVVRVHTRAYNQDGTLVAEFKRAVLVPRKPGAEAD